ncbi:MAG TPA: phosphoglycerate kinase [Candidatus Staskawiczbacteria bacterium]|nr:phosphoglycerate kinase [Candidatus Staskawiczbacteria bacterium]
MFKTLKEISAIDKRVLVRCDFNVPLDARGNIADDFRIRQAAPTIKYLVEQRARVILMSHLDPESTGVADRKYTMEKIAERLSEILGMAIETATDCIGPDIESQSQRLEGGKILLLENLRFYKEETDGDTEFAKKLSYLGELFVNEAFSVCHREHASIAVLPTLLPGYAGFLLEKEITNLDKVLVDPQKPMTAIVGGKKVETKSKFIDRISEVADFVIVSGLIKKEVQDKNITFKYPEKIIGPDTDLEALDINQDAIEKFKDKILQSKTVLWNGPFGKFEERKYAAGTRAIADAIIESGAYSVVGGGETVEFLQKQDIIQNFSHVSTGGGAMMAYLSGESLPGLAALDDDSINF